MYQSSGMIMSSDSIVNQETKFEDSASNGASNFCPLLVNEMLVFMKTSDQSLVREFLSVHESALKQESLCNLLVDSNFIRQWILMKILPKHNGDRVFPQLTGQVKNTSRCMSYSKNQDEGIECFIDYLIVYLSPRTSGDDCFVKVLESTLGTAVLKTLTSASNCRQILIILNSWNARFDNIVDLTHGKEFILNLLDQVKNKQSFDILMNSLLLNGKLTLASTNRLSIYQALFTHELSSEALLGFFWELNSNIDGYYDAMLLMVFNHQLSKLLKASVCNFLDTMSWQYHVQNVCFILEKHENLCKEMCFNESTQELLMSLVSVLNSYGQFFHEDLRMFRVLCKIGFKKMLYSPVGVNIFKFLLHTTHRFEVLRTVFYNSFSLKQLHLGSCVLMTKSLTDALKHDVATIGLLEAVITESNFEVKDKVLKLLSEHERFVAPKKIWDNYLR